VTFGCLNRFAKVSAPALETWLRILQALPASRLVLHATPGSHRDEIVRRFAAGGIAADRVAFAPSVSLRSHLQRYQELDVCLDPFPYNGGMSTMDALWMGVPVIALAGRTAVGRAGVSILSNVGLPELIAATPDEYVAIAVELSRDRARLAALRGGLRDRMTTSPLMDATRYAADVDATFRSMWTEWCGR
jgi:predicted O-linked N-acetylglucosamine transferase (SPINDLY family)